jgi:CubicO group peptidase (beta-lactamase class C family)
MTDTAFHVSPDRQARFTTAYVAGGGERRVYDEPGGQWAAAPRFASGGGGLVSTVGDMLAFGRALAAGGANVLSERSLSAMTSDQIAPLGVSIAVDDDIGWGYGVDVRRRSGNDRRSPGSYGWVGGLGTVWWNDPTNDLTAVLFTNLSVDGPHGAAWVDAFYAAVYGALHERSGAT